MKIKLLTLLGLLTASAYAGSLAGTRFTSRTVDVAGSDYDVTFGMTWVCDDFPIFSAPGVAQLLDSNGLLIGEAAGTIDGWGPSVTVSGPGSANVLTSVVGVWTSAGIVADGQLEAVWHITGLTPGSYTLRFQQTTSWDGSLRATTVWTNTYFLSATDVNLPPSEPPPPPPTSVVTYQLSTTAGAGGTVSAGGSFTEGTVASVSATADPGYAFAGWSGDAGGLANPLGLTMDGNKSILANFSPVALALATSALSGGNVTPGGSYPYGSWVTVAATPDATHYFTGWSGDAGGTDPSVNVLIDRAKSVVAVFAAKNSQVITFANPGDQPVGATSSLTATSSTGLPVTLTVVSGPATLNGNVLTVSGSGPVTLQATQNGDGTTLPASPVTVTFNATAAPAKLRVQTVARTILQDARTATSANYVLSNP